MELSPYRRIINQKLRPTLLIAGFKEIELESCMRPEILYQRGDLWFGTTWDWRDRYLDLHLGGLYWFKDVMPRVVVLGDYSAYCPAVLGLEQSENFLERTAAVVADTLPEAIAFRQAHPEIEAADMARFQGLIQHPVTASELSRYVA